MNTNTAMKNKGYIFLLILLQGIPGLPAYAQQKIKIACIGNSITYGYLINNREKNAYPAQLQALLGDGYQVINFGVSGKTALHAGGNPYIATPQYQDALNSNADIFFIMLGTNDSRPYYRKYIDSFYTDYKALVRAFKMLPTHPRVVLMYPVVNFLKPKPGDPYNMDIPQFIMPVIKKVADEEHCELIDLHSLLINHPEMYSDKMHPDSAGASRIARRLYEFLVSVKKRGVIKHQILKHIPVLQKAWPSVGDVNATLFHGNVPKYWKRSHNFNSPAQRNGFGNTI